MSTDFWEEREREKYKLMKELNSKPVKKSTKAPFSCWFS